MAVSFIVAPCPHDVVLNTTPPPRPAGALLQHAGRRMKQEETTGVARAPRNSRYACR
ncbi:hypothetical protein HMPREF9946_00381 [Acetobacteraceae bacterium AT-5844]|nr:hypothetical protein HMPREF9946_00381 [Acetobacteraceae bacterium AT-5844]